MKYSLFCLLIVLLPALCKSQDIFNYKKALTLKRTLYGTIESINRTTGEVVFGGVDTRGPTTPGLTFTWVWGDGTSINGFFPQTKKYTDITKNYVVKLISNYSTAEKDTVELIVDFIKAKITPASLDPKIKVYIPKPAQNFSFTNYQNPNQTAFPERIFDDAARSELEYLLQVGASVEYDFVNQDAVLYSNKFEQYMLRDSAFGGAYSLFFTKPVGFGAGDVLTKGNIDYSSLHHEMGHNFTLNTPSSFPFGGKLSGRASAYFEESIAQIFQSAAGYEIINNYQKHGLDETMLAKYKLNFFSEFSGVSNWYQEYISGGMKFATWSKVDGYSYTDSKDSFLTFMTVPYKFMENAEKMGQGYRLPVKRLMQFFQRFNLDWQKRYDPSNDTPTGNSFRATMWVAAMSHAFQKDLRADFRAINYPVSDTDWTFLNPALLDVSSNTISVSAIASNTISFSVLSSATSWAVTSSQSWLMPNLSNGSGNQVVTFTTATNSSITSRTAVITVSAAGFLDRIVTIIQAGASPTLAISAQSLSLVATPTGPSSVSVTSNTSWSVVSSQSWLTTTNSGTGNQVLSVSATANTLAAPRTATLTVSANGVTSQVITVTQAGAPATLSTSVASLTVEATGGTPSVNITSNTSWSVVSSQAWLTYTPTSGSGNAALTLIAASNTVVDSRTASITISANGVVNQTVVVVQRGIIITATVNPSEEVLQIYPNPVSDILHIEGLPLHTTILLYDTWGRLLHQLTSESSKNWLSTDNLPVGTYYLRVQSDQKSAGKRFMKIP